MPNAASYTVPDNPADPEAQREVFERRPGDSPPAHREVVRAKALLMAADGAANAAIAAAVSGVAGHRGELAHSVRRGRSGSSGRSVRALNIAATRGPRRAPVVLHGVVVASLLAAEHSHHRCRCARLSYGMCTLSPLEGRGLEVAQCCGAALLADHSRRICARRGRKPSIPRAPRWRDGRGCVRTMRPPRRAGAG